MGREKRTHLAARLPSQNLGPNQDPGPSQSTLVRLCVCVTASYISQSLAFVLPLRFEEGPPDTLVPGSNERREWRSRLPSFLPCSMLTALSRFIK